MSATGSKPVTRRRPTRAEKDRLMVIEFWRRSFKGERDPLAGVMRKFKIGPRAGINFFTRNQIYAMSLTKH